MESARSDYSDILLQQLELFATEGLRTLCCAVAELTEEDYNDWKMEYHKACTSIDNREGILRINYFNNHPNVI